MAKRIELDNKAAKIIKLLQKANDCVTEGQFIQKNEM